MLTFIFFILVLTIFFLFFLSNQQHVRFVALVGSGIVFICSVLLLLEFNTNNFYFQHVITYNIGLEFLNIYLSVGLDGISIFFFCFK